MIDSLTIKSALYDYSIHFENNIEEVLYKFRDNTVYVIDKNVYELYKSKLSMIDDAYIFYMDAIESKKNMDTVMDIICFWSTLRIKKNWKVLCIGGGITQDVTTIAANLYLRNIDWFFIPTTLLSMCDSCIGGKCGINLGQYKNQIGVFYPPKEIYIDTGFIDTLTDGDYLNGWGEILKFSLTSNADFYNELKEETCFIPNKRIDYFINEGLKVKKDIIEKDEFEGDYRRVLNYGHTFGHALEAYTNNEIPHGKGVIWGIDVVNYIAKEEGLISEEYYKDIKKLIKDYFLKEYIEITKPEELFQMIKMDKKADNKVINFAMLNGDSKLIVYPMNIDNRLYNMFLDYLGETYEYYNN